MGKICATPELQPLYVEGLLGHVLSNGTYFIQHLFLHDGRYLTFNENKSFQSLAPTMVS